MAESESKQTSTTRAAAGASGSSSGTGRSSRGSASGPLTGGAASEAGYYGTATDPTPREHYALDGVTSGKPTPETDSDAAETARKARG